MYLDAVLKTISSNLNHTTTYIIITDCTEITSNLNHATTYMILTDCTKNDIQVHKN